MGVTRQPFVGQLITVTSPEDPNVTFEVRRCGVAQQIERQNLNSTMRYRDDKDGLVSERDFPMGSMNVATVRLGLHSWNIENEKGTMIPITDQTIQTYLSPREFDFLLKEVLKANPLWSGNADDGEQSVEGN